MWWTIIHAKYFRNFAMRFVGDKSPKKSVHHKKQNENIFQHVFNLIYSIIRKKLENIKYLKLYIMSPQNNFERECKINFFRSFI